MYRKTRLETLEVRRALTGTPSDLLSDYVDISTLDLVPSYVSVDAPANHQTTPGGAFDGVVQVNIASNQGNFLGSGVLLPSGRHILTAAHNVTSVAPNPVLTGVSTTVTFHLPGGPVVRPVSAVTTAPTWNRVLADGSDWAVLELATDAPNAVPRHDIFRGANDLLSIGIKAGYGQGGQNVATLAAGVKREGENRYELFLNGRADILLFDFDNGTVANDTFGRIGAVANLGRGNEEVLNAPGDSGGPTFINGLVAGITSFVTRTNTGVGDIDGVLNFSVGEIGADTRVSSFAPNIDAIVNEPGLPVIEDVRLDGSGWTGRGAFEFDVLAPAGGQLKPIYVDNVDILEIDFSEHVLFGSNGAELTLFGSNGVILDSSDYTFSYDTLTHSGKWTFATPLPDDKYRIELTANSIRDTGGNIIDTEWTQQKGALFDNFADDTSASFPTGNGVPNGGSGKFQFFFSLLAGDANRNGIVNSSDSSPLVDVTGDGSANLLDLSLIATQTGTTLPLRVNNGDYNDNEIVDLGDYQVWRMTYGSTTDLRADGNGNGVIEAADYTTWRDNENEYSGWYTGPVPGAPALPPLVVVGVSPQVINVTISGSSSQHSPYSFDTVDGSGDQLLTVPVGGADTVSITFSEDVNVLPEHLNVVGLLSGNRPVLADFTYDILSMTATWRFTNWSLGDNYALSLSDEVKDIEGMSLDGEWTNPLTTSTTNSLVSEFPSGDGNPGGDFVFVARILPGDANLDGRVGAQDLTLLSMNWGISSGASFQQADFDGDGDIDINDYNSLSNRWGVDLQASLQLLADLDGDLDVDADDRDLLFANQGMSSPALSDGDLDGDGDVDIDDYDRLFEQYGVEIEAVA